MALDALAAALAEAGRFDDAVTMAERALAAAVEGGELARRRVPRAELVYPDPAENERVDTVLKRLLGARLIVGGESEGEPYVEPAHDALVRAWDKLLLWKQESEEYLPLQRRLTQAADDWEAAADEEAKQDLLWDDDPRLPQRPKNQLLKRQISRRGNICRAARDTYLAAVLGKLAPAADISL